MLNLLARTSVSLGSAFKLSFPLCPPPPPGLLQAAYPQYVPSMPTRAFIPNQRASDACDSAMVSSLPCLWPDKQILSVSIVPCRCRCRVCRCRCLFSLYVAFPIAFTRSPSGCHCPLQIDMYDPEGLTSPNVDPLHLPPHWLQVRIAAHPAPHLRPPPLRPAPHIIPHISTVTIVQPRCCRHAARHRCCRRRAATTISRPHHRHCAPPVNSSQLSNYCFHCCLHSTLQLFNRCSGSRQATAADRQRHACSNGLTDRKQWTGTGVQ